MLRWNVLANYVATLWSAVMAIGLVPVYVHYLGVEAYGVVGLLATLQAAMLVFDLGLGQALAREMARYRAGQHDARSIRDLLVSVALIYTLIAVVVALMMWLLSDWLAVAWLNPVTLPPRTVAQALTLSGVLVALRWVGGLARAALMGLEHQVQAAGVTIVAATLRGLGAVAVLILVARDLYSFIMIQTAVAAMELLVLAALVDRAIPRTAGRGRFNTAALGRVRHFALGVMGMSILAFLMSQVDKLLFSKLLSLPDFGYFMLATAISSALYMFASPITAAVGPRLARIAAEGRSLEPSFHRFSQLVAWLILPIAMTIAVFSGHVLMAWTNSLDTAQRLQLLVALLVLGTACNALMQIAYLTEIAVGKTRALVYVNLAALIAYVPLIYFGVRLIGPLAAGVAWLLLNLGYLLIAAPILLRTTLPGTFARWLGRDLLPVAGVLAIVLGLMRTLLPAPHVDGRYDSLGWLIAAGCVAAAAATITSPVGREVARGSLHRGAVIFGLSRLYRTEET